MMDTPSRDVVFREEDFAPLLRATSRSLGGWVLRLLEEPEQLAHSNACWRFAEEAHRVETFLDDFGGRQNRTFVTFGELLASTRGLFAVKTTGLHLRERLERYELVGDVALLDRELTDADRLLAEMIQAILAALNRESINLALNWSIGVLEVNKEAEQRLLLPRNIEFKDSVDEAQHIAEIAGRFLKVLETSRGLDLDRIRGREDLPSYVSDFATEERCRWYESAVHNIQSMYDTYVAKTALEEEHTWLRTLRGHASVSLHLLEMATGLVHFYQRHENDIRHEPAVMAVSAVVSKGDVLDLAVNTCLRQAYLMVEAASSVADRILETFVHRSTAELELPEGMTLHARPLALIVQVARHYGTPLEISLDGESCSGNSLMGLIMLGGKHPRPTSIQARGDKAMLDDLRRLFEAGLGEDGAPLPEELGYLRPG